MVSFSKPFGEKNEALSLSKEEGSSDDDNKGGVTIPWMRRGK